MQESLIDDDTLPLSRKSVLPGTGFFLPDERSAPAEATELEELLESNDVIVIADGDADGLACVAIIEAVAGSVGMLPTSPHEFDAMLELVATHCPDGRQLYVCDLVPDDLADVEASLASLAEKDVSIRWFDHHQWSDDIEQSVREAGVDLVVGDSDEQCTADVAVEALDHDLPAHLVELAAVTRDHDLWIKDDPRSDDLADFAHWADPDEFVTTVGEHGPGLSAAVHSFLADRREEKQALIDRAVDRATMEDVDDVTVAVTYGRCSQNEVAEALRAQGADAVVVVKPAGSASIRGSESFERCHEVAGLIGGGGHPRAAGCKPSIYDDMLDYAHHWVTEGAVAKQQLLDAFAATVDTE